MSAEAIRQKLLGRFREVARDRAERLSSALHRFDGAGPDVLEELSRELHTLKGEARMMGFMGISKIVHAAEDLLGAGLHGERLESMRRACESIPLLLEEPPEGGPSSHSLLAELQAFLAGPAEAPPVNEAEPALAQRQQAPQQQAVAMAPVSIRVDLDALDEIAGLAGDTLVEGARAGARTRELKELLEGWNAVSERLLRIAERADAAGLRDLTAVVEDDVHRLRTQAFRFFHHHAESVGGVRQLLGTLAERVAEARLIPLGELFADLPATAASLAAEQGKAIEVSITGADTGIDKAILPSLQDPLVHLLRNTIDHAIELPEKRAAAGKPAAGQLRISALPDGDRLQVVLEDDGAGIDAEKIRATAVKRGVLDAAAAAALSDKAALELIFAPGFSTRASAGETSGRGVGLDVVRRRVVSLGGAVSVESTPGVGTRFTLRLPQSLSLVKVLLVRIDDDVYGLPAADVQAVGRLEPSDVSEVAGVRVVRHRDRLVPVVAAGPLLGLNGGPAERRPAVAFVHHGDHGLALVVDGFRGEREVAVKAPGAFLQGRRFVSGAASLEDGRVALLLSTADLLAAAKGRTGLPAQKSRSRRRILLVDDSLIAREAEAALLRGLGHEVDEAADGEEGLRKLEGATYDLLVTDVQMPVMDGIELTRRVKGSETLRRTPVLILSSLATQHDKRRGLEAGADGYLGKQELDAAGLARLRERLCGSAG